MINSKWLTTTVGFDTKKISVGNLAILVNKDGIKGTGVVLEVGISRVELGLYCGPSPNNHTDCLANDIVSFMINIVDIQEDVYDLIIIDPYLYNEGENRE